MLSRTSHEVRGLKFDKNCTFYGKFDMSHLTRGAWIEILLLQRKMSLLLCRTSHEVRGLKLRRLYILSRPACVAPHTRCVD